MYKVVLYVLINKDILAINAEITYNESCNRQIHFKDLALKN